MTSIHHDSRLPPSIERSLYRFGKGLIRSTGTLLRLSSICITSAQVLFHRFYTIHSFLDESLLDICMASIFFSSKLNNCHRKCVDVVHVIRYLEQRRTGKNDLVVKDLTLRLMEAETKLLKCLGFGKNVEMECEARETLDLLIQKLDFQNVPHFSKRARSYLTEALKTDLPLCFKPSILAASIIQVTALDLETPISEDQRQSLDNETRKVVGPILHDKKDNGSQCVSIGNMPVTTEELEEYLEERDTVSREIPRDIRSAINMSSPRLTSIPATRRTSSSILPSTTYSPDRRHRYSITDATVFESFDEAFLNNSPPTCASPELIPSNSRTIRPSRRSSYHQSDSYSVQPRKRSNSGLETWLTNAHSPTNSICAKKVIAKFEPGRGTPMVSS